VTEVAQTQKMLSFSIYPSLLLYSFLIATSFPVGAIVANDIDPAALTAKRFFAASVIFLVILVATKQFRKPSIGLLMYAALLGSVMAIFFSLMFVALKSASALSTGAIFTLTPLLALIAGYFINSVSATSRQIIFLLIAASGAICIVFKGDFYELLALRLGRGELVFLIGTMVFSLYSPLTKRFYDGTPFIVLTFWVLVSAFVFTAVYSLTQATFPAVQDVPLRTWTAVLYLAAFPTAVTFFINTRSSTKLSPFKVASFIYLVPACVALIELVVYRHVPSLAVSIGILVTAIATFFLQFDSKKVR